MAHARTVFLDQSEINLIHAAGIESLRDMGIKVGSEPVLHMLEKNGASVDSTQWSLAFPKSW